MEILSTKSQNILALSKSELDTQVAMAKENKRSIEKVLANVEKWACSDEETASDCFYAYKIGKNDDLIEGLSIRFTEILAVAWGNLRIGTRIISVEDTVVVVQAVCHDLETNLFVSQEVSRRIIDKYGRRYEEDVIIMQANAASSIAYRNAVLKIIPKAITKTAVDKIRKIAEGKDAISESELITRRNNAVAWFKKQGVSEKELFDHLEIKSVSDIDKDIIMYLKGLRNTINEGGTTVDLVFRPTNNTTKDGKVNFFSKKEETSAQVSNKDEVTTVTTTSNDTIKEQSQNENKETSTIKEVNFTESDISADDFAGKAEGVKMPKHKFPKSASVRDLKTVIDAGTDARHPNETMKDAPTPKEAAEQHQKHHDQINNDSVDFKEKPTLF